MSLEVQNNYLQRGISEFLTSEKISEIALRVGLSTETTFSPNEYHCLVKMCTSIAIEKISRTNGYMAQNLREKATPIVNELLEKQCKKDNSAQEVMPQFLQDFLASVFWKITSPFYKE